jgi:hypothetical protein
MITNYQYIYSPAAAPNRVLEFYQDAEGHITVVAKALSQNSWIEISRIDESQMSIEALSTNKKMERMIEARARNEVPIYPKDQPLSALNIGEKRQLLQNLEPMGPWHISIQKGIGKNPRFETIKRLDFYKADVES